MVSLKRLSEILSMTVYQTGKKEVNNITKISVHNLTKNFEAKNILQNFTAEFKQGNIYTIVGSNGAGKTTLINAIIGLYCQDHTNCIFYNEIPLEEIYLDSLYRNSLGILEQEPVLFEDTIEFNLTVGCNMKSTEELEYFIDLLGLTNFIKSMPKGLQTKISENASNISGGEKQKICLIRALSKKPDVLILDEPTSALDKDAIEKLKEFLRLYKEERITIIATHDQSLNEISDDSIFM